MPLECLLLPVSRVAGNYAKSTSKNSKWPPQALLLTAPPDCRAKPVTLRSDFENLILVYYIIMLIHCLKISYTIREILIK